MLAAATLAFALIVQSIRLWWRTGAAARRVRVHAERAAVGEVDGARLLERLGYAIEGRQAVQRWSLLVDGESVPVTVRADYVVLRGGRRFVAEVKTGSVATAAHHVATRRQLLEYRHAFDVDGILLVDPEESRVSEISFPSQDEDSGSLWPVRLAWLIVGLAVGLLAAALSR
jgi:hypothetical protein